jgi:hypothetical protein
LIDCACGEVDTRVAASAYLRGGDSYGRDATLRLADSFWLHKSLWWRLCAVRAACTSLAVVAGDVAKIRLKKFLKKAPSYPLRLVILVIAHAVFAVQRRRCAIQRALD